MRNICNIALIEFGHVFLTLSLFPISRYAQIEKEGLALTWVCEKFQSYLIGTQFTLETDHKPLVPLLSTKNLTDLSPRIQRFRMSLMRYDFKIVYTMGSKLITADKML
jgi:hypothetical protein